MQKLKSFFGKSFAFKIFLIFVSCLPIFFIPFVSVTPDLAKASFFATGIFLTFFVWLIYRLIDGEIDLPWIPYFYISALVFLFINLLASLFSVSIFQSFFGYGYELDTFGLVVVALLTTFLASIFFQNDRRVNYLFLGLGICTLFLGIFHVARFVFGPEIISFGIFVESISTPFGKWNDLGILSALTMVIILAFLGMAKPKDNLKMVSYFGLIIFGLCLLLVNFTLAYFLLAFFALGLFWYETYFNRAHERLSANAFVHVRKRVYFLPIFVGLLAISLAFVNLSNQSLLANNAEDADGSNPASRFLTNFFSVGRLTEARPSAKTTILLAKETWRENLFLGAGPNRFTQAYLLGKSSLEAKAKENQLPTINESPFWAVDFSAGYSTFLTPLITFGLLGALAWLSFWLLSFQTILQGLWKSHNLSGQGHYLLSISFICFVFLFLASVFYVIGTALYFLMFLFLGVTIGLLGHCGGVLIKRFSIFENAKGFVMILMILVLLVLAICGMVAYANNLLAQTYFERGASFIFKEGNIPAGANLIDKAILKSNKDVYYRNLADITLVTLNDYLKTISPNNSASEEILQKIRTIVDGAITSANNAKKADPTNYLNDLTVGRVSAALIPLKFGGAYENALSAYKRALELNPESPIVYLMLAELELAKGDRKSARGFLTQSLEKKKNYTDAIFLLSQIEAADGNIREAVAKAEEAAIFSPDNPVIHFQVGLLKYNSDDFSGALAPFEKAVAINNNYSNARYFLGLTKYRLRDVPGARAQFEEVAKLNKGNKEVELILNNLRAGLSPFANDETNSAKPEKRAKPPVKDEN